MKLPYVRVPDLSPPGETTGYAHPKCYMSATNNCSEGKSREHYVSEAILQRFDNLNVSGMPWQEVGKAQIYPAKALVANILCERHNNALAPVDGFGVKAFDALTEASDYAVNNSRPGRAEHYLISGEGLELWMFKLAAGIHFGGIAATDGEIIRDKYDLPMAELTEALTTGKLPATSNLFVASTPGLVERAQIRVAPIIDTATNKNLGVAAQFGPLQFQTTIAAPPAPLLHLADLAYQRRPRVIDFSGPARDARVVLTWKSGLPNLVKRLGVTVQPPDQNGAAAS